MQRPYRERLKREWARLIPDKRRRNLLVAGGVILLLGLAYRLYPAYEGLGDGETDIAILKKRVATYRQAVGRKGELANRLVSLKRALAEAEAELLTGKTPALAAADIQNTLNNIALSSGVEINSVQVLQPQEQKRGTDLYLDVPVQFSVTLTTRQLKDILYKIETFPGIFLTVQWIRISAMGVRNARQVRCDMAVAGIMKKVQE